jgi:sRNA-binding protein
MTKEKPAKDKKSQNKVGVNPTKTKKERIEPPRKQMLSFELYLKVLRHMQEKYPKCFSKPPKPLAIGILKDVREECQVLEITRGQLQQFFKRYCWKDQYKQALVVGAERVDLEGNVRSTVTEEEVVFLKEQPVQSSSHSKIKN